MALLCLSSLFAFFSHWLLSSGAETVGIHQTKKGGHLQPPGPLLATGPALRKSKPWPREHVGSTGDSLLGCLLPSTSLQGWEPWDEAQGFLLLPCVSNAWRGTNHPEAGLPSQIWVVVPFTPAVCSLGCAWPARTCPPPKYTFALHFWAPSMPAFNKNAS